MDQTALVALAGQWGPMGLLIGYLLWSDLRKTTAQEKLDATKSTERTRLEEKKLSYDRERLEADKAMANALGALTAVIQGVAQGGRK